MIETLSHHQSSPVAAATHADRVAATVPVVTGIAPSVIVLVSTISAGCWASLAYAAGLL